MNTTRMLSEIPLAIGLTDHGYALVARASVAPGQVLFELTGEPRSEPSRYSVQTGLGEHIDLPLDCTLREQIESYAWSFLNHSCAPNTQLIDGRVIAIREIQSGDELTFDYDDNEYRMAEPFDCSCGAPNCRKRIGGFALLSQEEQQARLDRVPAHLRTLHG